MRPAMTSALYERKMIGILDRLGELLNRFRKQVGIVRHFDRSSDLRLGHFGRVQDVWLTFGQCPFEALLGAIDIEALAILPRDIV